MSIIHDDCLTAMAAMEPESVDAIVTDPPYNLTADSAGWRGKTGDDFNGRPDLQLRAGGFMGKTWDGTGIAFRRETWEAAYRVAKPSAYLLAFGGTRTVHRMTVALEDAGWIIRDMLVWAYASGFPKSKASLKPAWEPIVMARKPGPLRMLAIDECRIPSELPERTITFKSIAPGATVNRTGDWHKDELITKDYPSGRWPANVILTDPIFDGGVEGVVGGGEAAGGNNISVRHRPETAFFGSSSEANLEHGYGDSGTYSRFFLVPKASRSDREPVLTPDWFEGTGRVSNHPTVKPTELMRHLVRLVTPVGGVVLDPFGGSGTTAIACELEGFQWVLVEKEAEYVRIVEARLNGIQRGLGLAG